MVDALDQAGLRKIAPSVVGDYFPGEKPQQLARKANVCQGAKPQQHSHFFTEDGQFGSLDQHEEQVDDAPYRVVDDRTLRLGPEGEETYRYRIVGGDELTLEPVIAARLKREALANPLKFSPAAHMAAGRVHRACLAAGRLRRLVLAAPFRIDAVAALPLPGLEAAAGALFSFVV
jgi:hypothetical protein